ncbi:MAG TPA: class I SAM-dependent methyltransferase [Acidimicrobiales bacterium]|jgi:SAM-dependent methyltransferase
MPDTTDTNDLIWKSDEGISYWVSTAQDRERRRTDQRRLMAELLPFANDEQFTFVDLGAGTGAAARAVLDYYPGATAILADYSPQMMDEAHRELSAYDGRYVYVEFDLASGQWPAEMPPQVAAVISSLCVHHLPDGRKQDLFREIGARLEPGGWYLNYDPVAAEEPAVEAAWLRAGDRQDPDAAAKRANRSPEEHRHYENHVRYIIPLAPQLEFLRAAGFEAIDVYWKQLDYVIYGGRRPLRESA